VQFPGKKIRYALLFKGIEGDGKSFIGRLLEAALGGNNVKQISPTVLHTSFTDWATGACVGIMEELRMVNTSRWDVVNALKPYITNDTIEVHPKGKAAYTTSNTMNYIGFTNHADAIPMTAGDRRWVIIWSPFFTRAQLNAATGPGYYKALFDAVHNHAPAIRRWLMDHVITLDPDGVAPMTSDKEQMIAVGMSDEEECVREALAPGQNILSIKLLKNSLLLAGIVISDVRLPQILSSLGWSRIPGNTKWRGQTHRVWHMGLESADLEKLQKLLDEQYAEKCMFD
jgi:hypothetical protein